MQHFVLILDLLVILLLVRRRWNPQAVTWSRLFLWFGVVVAIHVVVIGTVLALHYWKTV